MLTACDPVTEEQPETNPQDVFFERLSLLCGKAFPGQLVSTDDADADMVGKAMVMHVTNCDLDEIQIPFHVAGEDDAWNRSRTWIITRTENGVRLKHRHRHEDGSLDKVSNYGGDTANEGTEGRQEFPIDAESISLFKTEGLQQSLTNTWAMELSPPGTKDPEFAYQLQRPEGPHVRNFRVAFDLSAPIEIPPPAWGE
jgi:hypothetical protein